MKRLITIIAVILTIQGMTQIAQVNKFEVVKDTTSRYGTEISKAFAVQDPRIDNFDYQNTTGRLTFPIRIYENQDTYENGFKNYDMVFVRLKGVTSIAYFANDTITKYTIIELKKYYNTNNVNIK